MRASVLSHQPAPAREHGEREIVYLVGPSGHPNFGDEFILRTWLRHLAAAKPEADVIVDCHTPGQAAVLYRAWHPRVTFVDTMWRISSRTAHLPAQESVAFATDVVADPGLMVNIVTGIELLARAHTVHLVGGGYINTVWPHHVALLAAAATAAEHSGGRAVATGQGLVPVGDPDRLSLVRELVSRFDVFDVRDSPSYDAIAGSGGREMFSGDDAWLGIADDDVYETDSEAAARDFVLCLQTDLMEGFADGQGADALVAAMPSLVESWNLSGDNVAAVEGVPGADRIIFDRLADLLPGAVFVPFTEVWSRGVPARAGQTWISTRFHFHLLAAAAGASGLALAGGSDYYPTKHRSLLEAGSHWELAVSADLPAEPPRAGGFARHTVDRLRGEKVSLAEQIYPSAPPVSLLRRVIRAGRSLRRN